MGLNDLVPDKPQEKEKHCPECGARGEETGRAELRCPSPLDKCEVMYWFPAE